MSQSSVNPQIKQIAARIKEMREILNMTSVYVADNLGISEELYLEYENAETDIPIGIIYKTASLMQIDSTLFLIGDGARMTDYTIVRKGHGVKIERYPGYSFSSLAINYIGRQMDPMIVTIKSDDMPAKLVRHGGQEFNYIISGKIAVTIKDKEFFLDEGDSIYFDPSVLHGQRAMSAEASFLTVINE
ncbi:MAG: XRE family transcriptional regulator [Oscillospiraceae bacterium]|nr:XRE family transcriptional regulator [Oscillospiraceae bacterium]